MSTSDWLKFGSGVVALGTIIPGIGPCAGMLTAILNIGSTASAVLARPEDLPKYESAFDTTLGDAASAMDSLRSNAIVAYDTSLNMVYSDFNKLNTVGANIANTSSGWQFPDGVSQDNLFDALSNGATRALYLQLLPQFYSIDAVMGTPVDTVNLIGAINTLDQKCDLTYPADIDPLGYVQYPQISQDGPPNDFLVLAGAISNNLSHSMQESLPSASLLATMFGDPAGQITGYLNFPQDIIFSNSTLLAYRVGDEAAMYSETRCWKPGCEWDLHTGISQCVGP